MNFEEVQNRFNDRTSKDTGAAVMKKVSDIINDIGTRFIEMDGSELSDCQIRLAGYKFYLADYLLNINRAFEDLKLRLKHIRATEWDVVTEDIKAKEGKVKNKEQIENALFVKTEEMQYEQMLFETLYFKYKLNISSIDSVLTAITQRISELKRQYEQQ